MTLMYRNPLFLLKTRARAVKSGFFAHSWLDFYDDEKTVRRRQKQSSKNAPFIWKFEQINALSRSPLICIFSKSPKYLWKGYIFRPNALPKSHLAKWDSFLCNYAIFCIFLFFTQIQLGLKWTWFGPEIGPFCESICNFLLCIFSFFNTFCLSLGL